MKKLFTIGLMAAVFSNSALADVDSMRTITEIGVDGGINYYFSVAEGINANCQYGVIFFADKASLSVLLTAKISGRRIKLLNYDTTTSTCKLLGFSIE